MLYRIAKITDLKGDDKTDDKALGRIDRLMDINPENININRSLYMVCVKPNVLKSLITSYVKKVKTTNDELVITTENSIYHLVREGDADE